MTTARGPEPYLLDRSGTRYALADARWRGQDGSPLALSVLTAARPEQIRGDERSLWRYSAALPVPHEQRISLGEGWTPMVPTDLLGHRVHL